MSDTYTATANTFTGNTCTTFTITITELYVHTYHFVPPASTHKLTIDRVPPGQVAIDDTEDTR